MFDFDINEVNEEIENPILADEKKAFSLIVNILERVRKDSKLRELENLKQFFQNDLRDIISKVEIKNEIELYTRIVKNIEKIYEITSSSQLRNKNIVAVAGGFSAGKSTFLNSLLDLNITLPADINPCSAIPTYILSGKEDGIETINFFSKKLKISREEFEAISHQFQDKYKISFSQVLAKLFVLLKDFPYKNICFLDTPGYTKNDTRLKSNNTDREKAKQHLITADNLIWLSDIENGTIKKEDLDFIKSLKWNKEKKILFVINKSDKKHDDDRERVREEIKEKLEKKGINYYGVSLYSSHENQEYNGNYIKEFLDKLEKEAKESNFINQLEADINSISIQLEEKKKELNKEDSIISSCIKNNRENDIENYKYILKILKENNARSYEYFRLGKNMETRIKTKIKRIIELARGVE